MSIPALAIKNRNLTWFLLALFLFGGVVGFLNLGKKEDSTFVIKSASVMCLYPGATPLEVEQFITEPLEREIQSMRNIYKVTSESTYGRSKILVELDPATSPKEIPQLWDELRRKCSDAKMRLPAASSEVIVSDDFGDVFGIYYALSADDGISFTELRDWAQRVKKHIITVDGVQKVFFYAEQTPVINLYVSLSLLANFSIQPSDIISTISRQNSIVNSGTKQSGELELTILESGSYQSLSDVENQLIFSQSGGSYRLRDIAHIERSYSSPPTSLMRVNGKRAIGIGISTEGDKDVVATGRDVERVTAELVSQMPLGINLEVLYPENKIAAEATNTFLVNLVMSVSIVILVIMLVMGLRAGLLIGSSLIFSIGGTLLIMQFIGEGLNRTSLAGFIIAMGMLVDNAIVVTDNAQNAILRGVGRRSAVVAGANAPKWNLLGATLIAIFSFLPLYLAPSSVAEIVKPLFVVLSISLLLSWGLALTQTPLFGDFLLSEGVVQRDPYNSAFYRLFNRFLSTLLRHRYIVASSTVALFFLSLYIMGLLPQNFFPSLDKPYFRADVILPEGYNIRTTESELISIEKWLMEQEEVKNVSITIGGTPPRYYLASGSQSLMPNFGNILVELYDKRQTADVEERFDNYVRGLYPDIWLRSSLFKLSPVPDASIEFGFVGENIDTLLRLVSAAQEIMWSTEGVDNVRNSWGNRIPTWQPEYSQLRGQSVGISRNDLASGLTVATDGYRVGEYREGDQIMNILLKDANINNYNLTNLQTLPLFSPIGGVYSVEQVSTGFAFDYKLGVIKRYNRQRVVKAQCDPARGVNTAALFNELNEKITSLVTIPQGYSFKVFGEVESQTESNEALAKFFPLTMVLIFVTLLLLFGNYKDPIMTLSMIPLIFIGVVLGLVVTGKIFNFFALLGLLGLIGMNIKNGVVLISQITELKTSGMEPSRAIIEATRSRVVPVVMASGTTILGMLPLLFDSLFGAMAATIMGGLFVATLLTICVLPVAYAIFHNVKFTKYI
ncbi:MAG: efflux RND transporter permease subunit [Rikenellaceae bacterium]